MENLFNGLNPEENARLLDVIPLVTLLVGRADGTVEDDEAEVAQKIVDVRAYTYHEKLRAFYQRVSSAFDKRLNHFLRLLPSDSEEAAQFLTEELRQLDPIIQKIEGEERYHLYQDLLSFAKHVAKATGGGFFVRIISPEEQQVIHLDMLTPVENYPGI